MAASKYIQKETSKVSVTISEHTGNFLYGFNKVYYKNLYLPEHCEAKQYIQLQLDW